jgi:hypothetical protein
MYRGSGLCVYVYMTTLRAACYFLSLSLPLVRLGERRHFPATFSFLMYKQRLVLFGGRKMHTYSWQNKTEKALI